MIVWQPQPFFQTPRPPFGVSPASGGHHTIYFDGRFKKDSSSDAGIGAVVYDPMGNQIWHGNEVCAGRVSKAQADYRAMILGLNAARNVGAFSIVVKGDSEVLINQMKGCYAVRSGNIRPYYDQACWLCYSFNHVEFQYIDKSENRLINSLAHNTLSSGENQQDVEDNNEDFMDEDEGYDDEPDESTSSNADSHSDSDPDFISISDEECSSFECTSEDSDDDCTSSGYTDDDDDYLSEDDDDFSDDSAFDVE